MKQILILTLINALFLLPDANAQAMSKNQNQVSQTEGVEAQEYKGKVLKLYVGRLTAHLDDEKELADAGSACFLQHVRYRDNDTVIVGTKDFEYPINTPSSWYGRYYQTGQRTQIPEAQERYKGYNPVATMEIRLRQGSTSLPNTSEMQSDSATIMRDYILSPNKIFQTREELEKFVDDNYDVALKTKDYKDLIIAKNSLTLVGLEGSLKAYKFFYAEVENGSFMGDNSHPLSQQRALAIHFTNNLYFSCDDLREVSLK